MVSGLVLSVTIAMSTTIPSAPNPEEALMIRRQLTGPRRGIKDEQVIHAMMTVPRHCFVPEVSRANAYADAPLSIGYGQTISQPYVVAYMTESLKLLPTDRVLEVGVGCGYQTAVLAQLVDMVFGIEIVEPLAKQATGILQELGIENVSIRVGDGSFGWEEQAPFDAILCACAPQVVPQSLIDQLAPGGRMVLPVGERYEGQQLLRIEKRNGKIYEQAVLPVRFVPMTGQITRGSA